MSTPFQDPRANDLLSRVSNDVSLLRQDVANLFAHTTRHTLPEGARGLMDTAKTRLADGRLYSAAQLRALRGQINQPATAWVGGAIAVGLIAAGAYWFLKDGCCGSSTEDEED